MTFSFLTSYIENPKSISINIYYLFQNPESKPLTMSQTVVLKVGMSCQGCSGAVKRVLDKMEGVESYDINLKEQKVTVKGNVQPEAVFQTVSKTGKKTTFWEEDAPAPESKPEETPAEPEEKLAETPVEPQAKPAETPAEPQAKPVETPEEPQAKPAEAQTKPTEAVASA